jgi:ribosomal protein L32
MQKNLVLGGIVVAVVAAAVVVWAMWTPANNANFPEGTLWMCTDRACGSHHNLSTKQLGEHYKANYGQLPKCPKCGKESVRAEKCDHCGKVYPQGRGVQVCPYCKKEKVAAPA